MKIAIQLIVGTLLISTPCHAEVDLPLENASFELGPVVQMQALPVGSAIDGGWKVIQGAVQGWGCERRSVPVYGCMGVGATVSKSGSFGVLLGSVNQGGMTQAGIERQFSPVDDSHVYEFRVWARSDGGLNGLEIGCGLEQDVRQNTSEWALQSKRGHSIAGELRLHLRAVTFPNGNNSCWAPIIDDVSLVDLGVDCDRNLTPDEQDPDCNGNKIADTCDIANGTSSDYGNDGIPDECQCFADLNGSLEVDGADIGVLLAFWGPVSPNFPRADVNRDARVDGADLGILLANWGPCPS